MAALEGGVAAVAASCGQAAQFMAIAAICRAGDNILSSSYLYGGVCLSPCTSLCLLPANFKSCRLGRHTTSSKVRHFSGADPAQTYLIDASTVFLKKFNIGVKFVNSQAPEEFTAAIDENTKAIYVESIGNPKNTVAPLRELADVRPFTASNPYVEHW